MSLTVYNAKVETKLENKMMHELERATKKKPPSVCWYSLIYVSKVLSLLTYRSHLSSDGKRRV